MCDLGVVMVSKWTLLGAVYIYIRGCVVENLRSAVVCFFFNFYFDFYFVEKKKNTAMFTSYASKDI